MIGRSILNQLRDQLADVFLNIGDKLIDRNNVLITVRDASSKKTIRKIRAKNRFTRHGRNYLRNLMGSPEHIHTSTMTPNYMAVGSGSTAVTDLDTGLVAEIFRQIITNKTRTDTLEPLILFQMILTSQQANGQELREAAIFSTEQLYRDCWARVTHELISKSSSIEVIYDWTLTLGIG